jgi:hypothetical protein
VSSWKAGRGGEGAVDLVGGDVEEAEGFALAGRAIRSRRGRLQQGEGAVDVGAEEGFGAGDGAVDVDSAAKWTMAEGRARRERATSARVADVAVDEGVGGLPSSEARLAGIAGVGELV